MSQEIFGRFRLSLPDYRNHGPFAVMSFLIHRYIQFTSQAKLDSRKVGSALAAVASLDVFTGVLEFHFQTTEIMALHVKNSNIPWQ